MNKLPNHTALKEWASVVSALRSGDQIVLIRKGGIADPAFGVEADRFYLFPTYLHQKEKQFRPEFAYHFKQTDHAETEPPEVSIDTWCEVARTFQITDLDLLRSLSNEVVFSEETILERYLFRPDQAVNVIVVRAHRLPNAIAVSNRSEYSGCRSWISLEEEIDVSGSISILTDEEFTRRVHELEQKLGGRLAPVNVLSS